MEFASLDAKFDGGRGLFVSLCLSVRSPDMAKLLLNGTLSLNSIKQWLCAKLIAKHIIASSCDSGDSAG